MIFVVINAMKKNTFKLSTYLCNTVMVEHVICGLNLKGKYKLVSGIIGTSCLLYPISQPNCLKIFQ
uniref:Uncharacterized protein n=1 Tax=Octopus bimaculoides TaxID=37653 RepID=A0A0L8FW40_OCTBM